MQRSMNWRYHLPEVFAPDDRPGADTQVYCKGCGRPLEGSARHLPGRTPMTVMMCSSCQQCHGHALIPVPGAPSFCYRCGGQDALFVAPGISPATFHICPRCVCHDRSAEENRRAS